MLDTQLPQKLMSADKKYGGDEMVKIFGPTILTWGTTDSSRMYMFTSNLKQTLTLLNPDVPRIQTGFENSVGKYSRAYKKLDGIWEVKNIIKKFSNLDMSNPEERAKQIITVVFYNKKTDTYDMIEKPIAEDLTEKFGFAYDTSVIDNYEVGDRLYNPIIYRSTSYDEHMNYRYGKNANVYYATTPDTIEDAVLVRKGWADSVQSLEVDSVQVTINDNDVLLNLYGDDDNYLPFPNIGEKVKNSMLCATRQINKQRLLFDFQRDHMRDVLDTDVDYYVSKGSVVYDIDVYYNGDEPLPDTIFYRQIQEYHKDNCRYAKEIMEATNQIKSSGSKFTKNVSQLRSRFKRFNDPEYKWKNREKGAFNHLIVEFKVRAIVGLDLGSKIAGRYANKGVISSVLDTDLANSVVDAVAGDRDDEEKKLLASKVQFVPDERMAYYIQDGKRVYADIQLNSSGAVRRLNSVQLMETEVNFIAEQVRQKVIAADTKEEKIKLIFKFMDAVNSDQSTFFRNIYDSYDRVSLVNGITIRMVSEASKNAFIKDVEENGFYIVRPPHKALLLDDVIKLYKEFPDITPVDLYVDLFGIQERKTIRKGIIGYQYMIILKQNTNKNFSARSTFRVNRSNLPVKDIAKKTNRSAYARTPVRLSEIHNLLTALSARDLAEWNIFMRSSAIGRKSLTRLLAADGNPLELDKLDIKDNFTNANADIFETKLKTLGLYPEYSPLKEGLLTVMENKSQALSINGFMVYDKPSNREMYEDLFEAFNKVSSSKMVISKDTQSKHEYLWKEVFDDKDIQDKYPNLDDTIKLQMVAATLNRNSQINSILNPESNRVRVSADDSDDNVVIPKKRGRKSNAEKARMEEERLAEANRLLEKDIIEDEIEDEIEEIEIESFINSDDDDDE